MTILDCDEIIHNIHEVDDSTDIMKLKFTGGGGTSFYPVLDYCKENATNVLLYFTDLYAESITAEDGYEFETMWICYSEQEAPEYGETIYYESKHAW
jgi:predicted metal-dependent peptidase